MRSLAAATCRLAGGGGAGAELFPPEGAQGGGVAHHIDRLAAHPRGQNQRHGTLRPGPAVHLLLRLWPATHSDVSPRPAAVPRPALQAGGPSRVREGRPWAWHSSRAGRQQKDHASSPAMRAGTAAAAAPAGGARPDPCAAVVRTDPRAVCPDRCAVRPDRCATVVWPERCRGGWPHAEGGDDGTVVDPVQRPRTSEDARSAVWTAQHADRLARQRADGHARRDRLSVGRPLDEGADRAPRDRGHSPQQDARLRIVVESTGYARNAVGQLWGYPGNGGPHPRQCTRHVWQRRAATGTTRDTAIGTTRRSTLPASASLSAFMAAWPICSIVASG